MKAQSAPHTFVIIPTMLRRLFAYSAAVSLMLFIATGVWWSVAAIYPRQFLHRDVSREGTTIFRGYGGFGWDQWAITFQHFEDQILFGKKYDAHLQIVGQPTDRDERNAAQSELAESQVEPSRLNFYDDSFRYDRQTKLQLFVSSSEHWGYGRKFVIVAPFRKLLEATGVLPVLWAAAAFIRKA